jgi:hypothetical protein
MDFARMKRLALLFVACLAVLVGGVALMAVVTGRSGSKPGRGLTVDLQVITDSPDYYWAAVYVVEPLTPDEYRGIAKSIGDEHFGGRFGQVQVFDDEWARDMMLPEHQSTDLTDEDAARWLQHHVMTYAHDKRGYGFDR